MVYIRAGIFVFQHGMTALSIAQRLGYISVVEELKVVTETTIASKHELITEERYKVKNAKMIAVIFFSRKRKNSFFAFRFKHLKFHTKNIH